MSSVTVNKDEVNGNKKAEFLYRKLKNRVKYLGKSHKLYERQLKESVYGMKQVP